MRKSPTMPRGSRQSSEDEAVNTLQSSRHPAPPLIPGEIETDPSLLERAMRVNPPMRYLASIEPSPELVDDLATFGRFLGSWDLVMASVAPDGTRTELVGEWHFGWALRGRAIQDVLITRTPTGELVGYGTTVRTYDDRDGKWWIVWQDPLAHEFAVLYGRPRGAWIELEGQWPIVEGKRFRWMFSQITATSFHWEAQLSVDNGVSWTLIEAMDATRRPDG